MAVGMMTDAMRKNYDVTFLNNTIVAILNKELQEFMDMKNPKRNLKNSLLSLGFLILAGMTFLIGVDSFYPGHSDIVTSILIIFFYGLMGLSAILAVLTLTTGFTLIKTSKDRRNNIAIGITILVLLAIASEILKRL